MFGKADIERRLALLEGQQTVDRTLNRTGEDALWNELNATRARVKSLEDANKAIFQRLSDAEKCLDGREPSQLRDRVEEIEARHVKAQGNRAEICQMINDHQKRIGALAEAHRILDGEYRETQRTVAKLRGVHNEVLGEEKCGSAMDPKRNDYDAYCRPTNHILAEDPIAHARNYFLKEDPEVRTMRMRIKIASIQKDPVVIYRILTPGCTRETAQQVIKGALYNYNKGIFSDALAKLAAVPKIGDRVRYTGSTKRAGTVVTRPWGEPTHGKTGGELAYVVFDGEKSAYGVYLSRLERLQ